MSPIKFHGTLHCLSTTLAMTTFRWYHDIPLKVPWVTSLTTRPLPARSTFTHGQGIIPTLGRVQLWSHSFSTFTFNHSLGHSFMSINNDVLKLAISNGKPISLVSKLFRTYFHAWKHLTSCMLSHITIST